MQNNNNIPQELLDTIERYLKGELSTRELDDFNRLLDLDEDFKAQVEEVRTKYFDTETQSLKNIGKEAEEAISKTKYIVAPQKQKARFLRYSRIAAATAVILVVGSIWFFSTPKNEKLYNNYFKPAPGLQNKTDSDTISEFYIGMRRYNESDYSAAIAIWKIQIENNLENDTLNYFLGVAHLANKKEANAIPYLERTVQSKKTFPLLSDANYYLALSYLKQGNFKSAKKHLASTRKPLGKELLTKLEN